jgi:SAM-dependent methyltransferase
MASTDEDWITYWNESGGAVWVALQSLLDKQLAPLGEEVMRSLDLKAGEHVLDVGCGCGDTSLRLAERVGPGGAVLGVDVSAPMLAVARRAAEASGSGAAFRVADAGSDDLGEHVFDAVFSRFGVMFFADPAAAFSNIRASIKPGGRLGFVCWRQLDDNAWMNAPLRAAAAHLPAPPESDPLAPGPFAFADGDRVRRILADAGFSAIKVRRFDTAVGGNSLEDSLRLALGMGPLGKLLRENPEARPKASEAVRRLLEGYATPDGILLPASVWIVGALPS